ncbi:MAG: hypothetical protein ABEJ98_03350 [Candidatus Nanohaloarchaea archaeon]
MTSTKRNKGLAVVLGLGLMISGAAAWQFTGTIATDFKDFLKDEMGIDKDQSLVEKIACGPMTSYFVSNCDTPIDVNIGGSTVGEIQWSIYNAGLLAKDKRDQVTGALEKRLNASYGVATAQAKAKAIKDLNAGRNEDTAKDNATDFVRNWYAEIQRNLLMHRNREALKFNETIKKVRHTSGLKWKDVIKSFDSDSTDQQPAFYVKEENVSLVDGSTATGYYIIYRDEYGGAASQDTKWERQSSKVGACVGTKIYPANMSFDQVTKCDDVEVLSPDGNASMFLYNEEYRASRSSIVSTKDRAVSNLQTMLSDIYSKYDKGEIEMPNALGPLETIKVASTSYNSTGYYDYATATATQMGLNTNETYAFELNWSQEGISENHSDTGQLFLEDNAFNGTVEVGKEYNVTDQTVWFTHTVNNDSIEQTVLNGTFTVTGMTNKNTGESINKTSVQDIQVYEANNISKLQAQLSELKDQLEEEKFDASQSSGSSATGLFGASPAVVGMSFITLLISTLALGAILA